LLDQLSDTTAARGCAAGRAAALTHRLVGPAQKQCDVLHQQPAPSAQQMRGRRADLPDMTQLRRGLQHVERDTREVGDDGQHILGCRADWRVDLRTAVYDRGRPPAQESRRE